MIQQKIEFQDVLLIKLKVVHESANAMTKTFLLKSCSWSPQNCRGIMCVYVCVCVWVCVLLHVSAKNRNENSLKSSVTLLRDAVVCLQVPWPFSILSLWKRNKTKYQVITIDWNCHQIKERVWPFPQEVKSQDKNPSEDWWLRKLLWNCWGKYSSGRLQPSWNSPLYQQL